MLITATFFGGLLPALHVLILVVGDAPFSGASLGVPGDVGSVTATAFIAWVPCN